RTMRPTWNFKACWRVSTVNTDMRITITATTARINSKFRRGPMAQSSLTSLALARAHARAWRARRRSVRRRLLPRRRQRAALHELIERQVQQVVAALRVDQHFRGGLQYLFQGFDVDALARHGRRLLILGEDLREPVGLALGIGNDLSPIRLGILPAPRRFAARSR